MDPRFLHDSAVWIAVGGIFLTGITTVQQNKDKHENTAHQIAEIKEEQVRKRLVDIEQTRLIERISTQLEANAKILDKVEKKLDDR